MYKYSAGCLNNESLFTVQCKTAVIHLVLSVEGPAWKTRTHVADRSNPWDTQKVWDEQEGDRRELNCGSESL